MEDATQIQDLFSPLLTLEIPPQTHSEAHLLGDSKSNKADNTNSLGHFDTDTSLHLSSF